MFMANLLIEIAGWIGAALVVIAYFLITYKKLDRESKIYHAMNLVGGLLTGVNAAINQAYPSTALCNVGSSCNIRFGRRVENLNWSIRTQTKK